MKTTITPGGIKAHGPGRFVDVWDMPQNSRFSPYFRYGLSGLG